MWVCTGGADKAAVCVRVCRGPYMWVCTGGAGIVARVCVCACM